MKIFMIRHGKADYSYGDEHNFIGHGHDLAILNKDYINDVILTAKDKRLKQATLIVSSPYTRALQTAAIISKEIGIDISIEYDLREWEPDDQYLYKKQQIKEIYKDYTKNNGVCPKDRIVNWESKEHLKNRINGVIEKYKGKYECIIFVFHQMAIKSVTDYQKIEPAEIVEYNV